MGKPGLTADRSCSGALSRRIAHRVSMHVPLHNGVHFDAVVPKMSKQDFAFPASLRTRFLNWKVAPAAYYNHPNNHPRDRCRATKPCLPHETAPCQWGCGECCKGGCIPQLPCPAAAMAAPQLGAKGPASWNCCSLGGGTPKWQCYLCAATKCGAQAGFRCRG